MDEDSSSIEEGGRKVHLAKEMFATSTNINMHIPKRELMSWNWQWFTFTNYSFNIDRHGEKTDRLSITYTWTRTGQVMNWVREDEMENSSQIKSSLRELEAQGECLLQSIGSLHLWIFHWREGRRQETFWRVSDLSKWVSEWVTEWVSKWMSVREK